MTQRLLSVKFQLHDVRDVEALCWSILERTVRAGGGYLSDEKKQDLVGFLMRIAWQISGLDERGRTRTAWVVEERRSSDGVDVVKRIRVIHDRELAREIERVCRSLQTEDVWVRESSPPPGCYQRDLGPSFSTYISRILVKRVVDWYRKELGDNRYRQRQQILSLDAISEEHGISIADLVGPDPSLEEEEVLTRVSLAG